MKIAIVGASGFIGTALTKYLTQRTAHELVLFSHQATKLHYDASIERRIKHIDGSVLQKDDILGALKGCDMAVYLVHLMGNRALSSSFMDAEKQAANNFAAAVTAQHISRVIYVGGMAAGDSAPTNHLASRDMTGQLIKSQVSQLIELRTPMVIGEGGAGFEVLKSIVRRSPFFPIPSWAKGVTQPITVHDVVAYITAALEIKSTEHLSIAINGPEKLTYSDVAQRYAKSIHKRLIIMPLPFVPQWLAIRVLTLHKNNNYALTVADMIGSAGYTTETTDNAAQKYAPQVSPEPIEHAF